MLAFNALAPTRYGPMIFHRMDQYVGRSLDLYGEFSAEETRFLCSMVGPGSVVLDGGANVGALTIPLARKVGPHGQVYAIEPQRLTYQALCANLALNSLSNVSALKIALGRAPGEVRIPMVDLTQPVNVGGFSVKGHTVGEKVPLVRIDDLGLSGLTLLKLDIEGMERDAIVGARKTIKEFQPLLYLEADRQEQVPGLIEDLKSMRYRLFWHITPLYVRSNFRDERTNLFPGVVSINIFAVPGHDSRDFQLPPVTDPHPPGVA